jgi:hypothetical protein
MKALHLTAVIAAILFFAIPEGLDSCGIGAPLPVFVTLEGPADVAQFLKGKLGVLRRSYHPRHLIGAFRVLSGLPLTDGEIDSLYQQSGGGGTPYFGERMNVAPEPATGSSPPTRTSASVSACPAPCTIIGPKHSLLKMLERTLSTGC